MSCICIDINHFHFKFERIRTILHFKCLRQTKHTFLFHRFFAIIKGIELRLRKFYNCFLVAVSHRNDSLIDPSYVHQAAQRHVVVDRGLVFTDHKNLLIRLIRKIILKMHVQRVFNPEFPDRCIFRQFFLMQCIIKCNLILLCRFILIE